LLKTLVDERHGRKQLEICENGSLRAPCTKCRIETIRTTFWNIQYTSYSLLLLYQSLVCSKADNLYKTLNPLHILKIQLNFTLLNLRPSTNCDMQMECVRARILHLSLSSTATKKVAYFLDYVIRKTPRVKTLNY